MAGEQGDDIVVSDYPEKKPSEYLDSMGYDNVKDVYVNKNHEALLNTFIGEKVLKHEMKPLIINAKRVYDIAVILTTASGKLEIGLQDPENMGITIKNTGISDVF